MSLTAMARGRPKDRTIRKSSGEAWHLSGLDERVEGDVVTLRKARDGGRGAAIVARMRGTATRGLSTDEIMRLTRE